MNIIFILLNFILCQSDHIDQLGNILTPSGFIYNGWDMTWFPADDREHLTPVTNVVSPNNDLLIFDTDMLVRHGISHLWTDDPSFLDPIYRTPVDGAQLTMTFPPDTNAFIFFLSSNHFGVYNFTLSYANGDNPITVMVHVDPRIDELAHAFAISKHNINGFPSGITISDQTPDPPPESLGFLVGHFLINQKSCNADPCECQPGRVCGNYPLREIDYVESAADCCYLCQSFTSTKHKRRHCQSFDYYEIGKECRLFDHVCQDIFVEDCDPVNPFIVGGNINYKFHAY